MSYVFGNDGVVKDPYAAEEFQRLQAFLKGLEERVGLLPEKPDAPVNTKPPNPDTPGSPTIGQHWMTGSWTIGQDGQGVPKGIPSYAVCQPAELNADQDDFAPEGIDTAIVLEVYASVALSITGLRASGRTVNQDTDPFTIYPRRFLAVLNRGGGDLSLINESSDSLEQNRFSWGTSGDVDEAIVLVSGASAWLMYDPRTERWRLFGVPAVGGANLPPSMTTRFPPDFSWSAARTREGATNYGIGEGTPVETFDTAAAVNAVYGFGRRLNTSAVSGNGAGITGSGAITMPQCDPTWTYIFQSGASVAAVRIWIVLSTGVTSDADELGAINYMGFRFSTVAGDAGWLGVTKDGATQALTAALGAAVTADTLYKLKLRKSGSSVFFSVNDGAETEHTSNLPTATSQLTWRGFVYTQAAAVKSHVFFQEHLKHSTVA